MEYWTILCTKSTRINDNFRGNLELYVEEIPIKYLCFTEEGFVGENLSILHILQNESSLYRFFLKLFHEYQKEGKIHFICKTKIYVSQFT